MSHPLIASGRLAEALTYDRYLEAFAGQAGGDPAGLDAEAAERLLYTGLNLHRTLRLGRTWRPSAELAAAVAAIARPQTWLVLTEPWCGDSAQCLPCLAVLAALNPLLELRLLLRDANLDVMDRFLTDGKRSIPRLVAFGPDGEETFTWGPRPQAAQAVFDQAKAEGLAKPELLERLHLWYGRDRGRALDAEFLALLSGTAGA